MQSSGITVFTETSSSFIPLILHEEIQGILPVLILHSEDKELFDSFYIQKARRSSIQSTRHSSRKTFHRHSSSSRTFQSFMTFQTFQSFMTFQPSRHYYTFQYFQYPTVFSGIPPIPAFLQLECKFYTPIGFHQKLH